MSNKKLFIQTIILIIILILITSYAHVFFLPKNNFPAFDFDYTYSYCMWKEFYRFDKNELEIISFGSSHSNCTIIPAVLNNKLKVNSFNLSTIGANIDVIYFQLKEVLKTHSPKIVTIEMFSVAGFGNNEKYYEKAFSGMKLSRNKYDAVKELLPNQMISNLFPLINNRLQWKNSEISKDLIGVFTKSTKLNQYGYLLFNNVYENEEEYLLPDLESKSLNQVSTSDKDLVTLQKISDLCKKNDVQLIFVVAPFILQDGYDYIDLTEKVNALNAFCIERNIPVINYAELIDEIGINLNDFADPGHLNISGAVKTTDHLSNYLDKNYSDNLNNCTWDNQTQSKERYTELIKEKDSFNKKLNE